MEKHEFIIVYPCNNEFYYVLPKELVAMGAAGSLGVLLSFVFLFFCFCLMLGWGCGGWDVNVHVHVTLMMLR